MDGLRIVYDERVFYKIMRFVNEAGKDEISGLGRVIRTDTGFKVISAMLLPQRNGMGHTDIEPEDMARAEYQTKDEPGELRLWWHSHVKMGCFWSATDKETIELLGRHGWYLATVFNQNWEHRSALYIGGEQKLFIDDIRTSSHYTPSKEDVALWDAEFKKNVTDIAEADRKKRIEDWKSGRALPAYSSDAFSYSQLSKKERRRIIDAPINDPLAGIFLTHKYGKVFLTENDIRLNGIWRPSEKNPHVHSRVLLQDLAQDIKHIRYASPLFVSELDRLVRVGFVSNETVEEYLIERDYQDAVGRGSVGGVSTDIPDDEGNSVVGLHEDDDAFYRRIYDDWDELPVGERAARILEFQMSQQTEIDEAKDDEAAIPLA